MVLGKVSCSALHADRKGLVAWLSDGTICVQTVLESGVSNTGTQVELNGSTWAVGLGAVILSVVISIAF